MAGSSTWYGLALTNPTYWSLMAKAGRWSYRESMKQRMRAWKAGARAVVYLVPGGVPKVRGIVAIIRVEGEPVKSNATSGFHSEFPWSLPFKVERTAARPIDLAEHVSAIQTFVNKKHWGSYLQGKPCVELTSSDFDVLERVLVAAGAR